MPPHAARAHQPSGPQPLTSSPGFSEIDLEAELHQPPLQHLDRALPRRSVDVVLRQHRIRIHDVVDVDDPFDAAAAAEYEHLADAEVDLIQPIAVVRPWRNQI